MHFISDPCEKFLTNPIMKWWVSEDDVGMDDHLIRYFEDIIG